MLSKRNMCWMKAKYAQRNGIYLNQNHQSNLVYDTKIVPHAKQVDIECYKVCASHMTNGERHIWAKHCSGCRLIVRDSLFPDPLYKVASVGNDLVL